MNGSAIPGASRRILLVAVLGVSGVAVVFLLAFLLPPLVVNSDALTVAERLELQNSVRGTVLQGLAGALFLTTAFFTWRQVQIAQRRLEIERSGQVTERFSRAIDQLGSASLEVRLGAVYSLEQIARQEPGTYHVPVLEVLSAYVRRNAPKGVPRPVGMDVLAVTAVLARRTPQPNEPGLDLREISLARSRLRGADLCGADLTDSNLIDADLTKARMKKAILKRSCLAGADLTQADLGGADLADGHLGGATLTMVDLTGAFLGGAVLERADLTGSQMSRSVLAEADLAGADLTEANLAGADLTEANLAGADLTDADLTGSQMSRSVLAKANLAGADLTEANLAGADLTDADLTDVTWFGVVYDEATKWPAGFRLP
jgi:uncharacterized protein YjbI with pentapeptide repeats/HAMP domain-containing protein